MQPKWMLQIALLIFCLFAGAPQASAHGLGYALLDSKGVIAFDTQFSDGTPVSYAEVLVYAPDNKDVEFQNGRTDASGKFAFVPASSGLWHVVVNAGMGHKLTFDVSADVASKQVSSDNSSSSKPTLISLLLGLSILANVYFLFRMRKQS